MIKHTKKIKSRLKTGLLCLLLVSTTPTMAATAVEASTTASQPVIYYFGTNKYKLAVKQASIENYNLDELNNLEDVLTKKITAGSPLPKDPEAMDRVANERMEKLDLVHTMHINKRLFHIVQGVARLVRWDIKKLPAFVFDNGQYVVYGVTDPHKAISKYNAYTKADDRD